MAVKTIKDLIKLYHKGRASITPYAVVTIHPASVDVPIMDFLQQKRQLQESKKSKPIVFDTRSVVNKSNMRSSYGAIEQIDMELNESYGGSFQVRVLDTQGGRQINKFINEINKSGTIVTSYAFVKFGWLASGSIAIESPEIPFMIDGLTSNYDGNNLYYTLTGSNIAAVFFSSYIVAEGKFKGTVVDALKEWQRVTGIEVRNLDIVRGDTLFPTTDSLLMMNSNTPLQLLERILSYAVPVNPKAEQVIRFRMSPDGTYIVLTNQSDSLQDIFDSYVVGEHDSIIQDFVLDNDFGYTKVAGSRVMHHLDPEKMKYEVVGPTDETTKTSTVRATETVITSVPVNNQNVDPNLNQRLLNRRWGSMTIFGDPSLIPTYDTKPGSKFYTMTNPFLGIDIKVKQFKPVNLMDLNEPISSEHWMDGIYMVNTVRHSLNSAGYTTTLEFEANASIPVIFKGVMK